jgi:acylphosphatase
MEHPRNPGSQADLRIQRRVFVSGRVQGVGFRASTLEAATEFPELRGFVRNLPDGRVEAVFAGGAEPVLRMVAWCRRGPPGARVVSLEVREEAFEPGLGPFEFQR